MRLALIIFLIAGSLILGAGIVHVINQEVRPLATASCIALGHCRAE